MITAIQRGAKAKEGMMSKCIHGVPESKACGYYELTVKNCPYCEIDRLKGELEQARQMMIDEIAQAKEDHKTVCDLQRQLDASQALLAEANEHRHELQTANIGLRKQLAEANEREDVDSMRIHLFDEEVQCLRKYLAEANHTIERLVSEAAETPELLKELSEAKAKPIPSCMGCEVISTIRLAHDRWKARAVDAERQLAEARAEVEALKRVVSSTERWEKLDDQLKQARQETARECARMATNRYAFELAKEIKINFGLEV